MNVTFSQYLSVIQFGEYSDNKNTAIQLIGQEGTGYANELIATATVNTERYLSSNRVAIKTWSENKGMVEALVGANVIEPMLLDTIRCGFVHAEIYGLTDEAIRYMESEANQKCSE